MNDLELAIEVVRTGATVATSYLDRPLRVHRKGIGSSVVTKADVEAEHAMVALLKANRPQDGILGEEGSRLPGARTWVVDPIDGTENYVVQDPLWCTAVALIDAEGAVVSAVHHQASGDTFYALRGAGAWHCVERTSVADRSLKHARLATYVSTPVGLQALLPLIEEVATVRMWGSGTMELAWLAGGRLDIWIQPDVEIWDWVPGALLVQESGGEAFILTVRGVTWNVACSRGLRSSIEVALGRTAADTVGRTPGGKRQGVEQ